MFRQCLEFLIHTKLILGPFTPYQRIQQWFCEKPKCIEWQRILNVRKMLYCWNIPFYPSIGLGVMSHLKRDMKMLWVKRKFHHHLVRTIAIKFPKKKKVSIFLKSLTYVFFRNCFFFVDLFLPEIVQLSFFLNFLFVFFFCSRNEKKNEHKCILYCTTNHPWPKYCFFFLICCRHIYSRRWEYCNVMGYYNIQ